MPLDNFHNLDALFEIPEEDDVILEGEATKVGSKLGASAADRTW